MDRIAALAEVLRQEGVDAFFATSDITMGYLHGLFEDGHERLLTLAVSAKGEVRLICPALSANQASRAGIKEIAPWKDGEDPLEHVRQLSEDWNLRSGILAVDNTMQASILLQLQEALPAALFKPGQPVVSQLMRRKSPEELALLKKTAQVADEAFLAAFPQIRAGMTELQVGDIIEGEMRKRGGVPEFCIVATGPGSAEPHHINDDTVLKEGDVLILDFGCRVGHYISDITRTVAVGHASEEAKKVYDVVFRAHHAARAVAKAGTTGEAVDRAARQVIEDAGYGPYFVHRTGHGIGMRGHEEPYIVSGNDQPLEAGNCFSIEPGIYLPGVLGVRIENIVTATEDGCVSLNAEPASEIMVVGQG